MVQLVLWLVLNASCTITELCHRGNVPAVIVGDDADLVLMACVAWTDNLYVANSAMAENSQGMMMPRDMPVSLCTLQFERAKPLTNLPHNPTAGFLYCTVAPSLDGEAHPPHLIPYQIC
jgi:hypothetical protein